MVLRFTASRFKASQGVLDLLLFFDRPEWQDYAVFSSAILNFARCCLCYLSLSLWYKSSRSNLRIQFLGNR